VRYRPSGGGPPGADKFALRLPERGRVANATVSSESSEILYVEGEVEVPEERRNARLIKGPSRWREPRGNGALHTSCRPEQALPQALAGPRARSPRRSLSAPRKKGGREGHGSRSPKATTKPNPQWLLRASASSGCQARPDAQAEGVLRDTSRVHARVLVVCRFRNEVPGSSPRKGRS
jgi:hypothetical protein